MFLRWIGLPRWPSGKESTCQCRRSAFDPWVRKIPWRRKWQPTPVFLPGKSCGQRSLVGYSPWSCKELDTTKHACSSLAHIKYPKPSHLHAANTFYLEYSFLSIKISFILPDPAQKSSFFPSLFWHFQALSVLCFPTILCTNLQYSLNHILFLLFIYIGSPRWHGGKEFACQYRRFDPWVRKIPWRRKWQLTPVFLLGRSYGQRSLVAYSPWVHRVGHDWATEHVPIYMSVFVS